MKKNIVYLMTMLVAGSFICMEAKSTKQYTQIESVAKFDTVLKNNKHLVVWFYRYINKGDKKEIAQSMTQNAYEAMSELFNKVADAERYEDKDISFITVNVSTKGGREIFVRYNELNDDTLVELPAILLFRNGKMIDNQIGGVMTKPRVKSFIERYFKRSKK